MQALLTPPPTATSGVSVGGGGGGGDVDTNIPRCHTMPVKQLAAMAKALRTGAGQEGAEAAAVAAAGGCSGSSGTVLPASGLGPLPSAGLVAGQDDPERPSRASKISLTSMRSKAGAYHPADEPCQ